MMDRRSRAKAKRLGKTEKPLSRFWIDSVSNEHISGWLVLENAADADKLTCFINGSLTDISLFFGVREDVKESLNLEHSASNFSISIKNFTTTTVSELDISLSLGDLRLQIWKGSMLGLILSCAINRFEVEHPYYLEFIANFNKNALSESMYISNQVNDGSQIQHNSVDHKMFTETESLGIRNDVKISRYQAHLYWRHTREHPAYRTHRTLKVATQMQIAQMLIWNLRNLTPPESLRLPCGVADLEVLNALVPSTGLNNPGKAQIELTRGQYIDIQKNEGEVIFTSKDLYSSYLLSWLGSFGLGHNGSQLLSCEQVKYLNMPSMKEHGLSWQYNIVEMTYFLSARYRERFGKYPSHESFATIDQFISWIILCITTEVKYAKSILFVHSIATSLFSHLQSESVSSSSSETVKTFLDRILNIRKREESEDSVIQSVNVIGMIESKSGLGQNARNSLLALNKLKESFTSTPISLHDRSVGSQNISESGCYSEINLIHINPDNYPELVNKMGSKWFLNSYNIGFFAWELDQHPKAHRLALRLVDEVWVPSNYVANSFRKYTTKPVIVMPHAIVLSDQKSEISRKTFGISDSAFLVHVAFDLHSWSQRKNPVAALDAIKLAFSDDDDYVIFVKIRNGRNIGKVDSDNDGLGEAVIELAEMDSRIILDFDERSDSDTQQIMAMSDCFVSLHRSEGFGYSCAEAAVLGVPVVASSGTGASEYLNLRNSFVVRTENRYLNEGEYVYSPAGSSWDEPDLIHAAELIRLVKRQPQLAFDLANIAKKEVTEKLSIEKMSDLYSSRLTQIRKHLAEIGHGSNVGFSVGG